MEVACSLDDVARVLADDGYNFNDDSCFANATDLPSMLSALDSPDSFPESPCSDEDIARVLDITRMTSPLLLESCTQDAFPSHINITRPSNTKTFDTNLNKTRDPCITNAVLNNSLLHSVPSFQSRGPLSPDIFSLALNCPLTDDTSHFNSTFVGTKESYVLNNYFNSSSALSPLSEPDTILPNCSEGFVKSSQPISHAHHDFDVRFENHPHHQIQFDLSPGNQTICLDDNTNNLDNSTTKNQVTSQTKRKRRRKTCHRTSKSKRKKQDTTQQTTPKPKQNTKSKAAKEAAFSHKQQELNVSPGDPTALTAKRQATNNGRKTTTKTKSENRSLDNIAQITKANNKKTKPTEEKPPIDRDENISEIGSTNGVIGNEPKTPRRSSRATKNTENYNFRTSSLVKRVETERKQKEPKQPKDKSKPPPLSKYRRRTANARERDRMKEINDAFEVLKDALPDMEPEDDKQKMTKFTVLKLALNYISSLQETLGYEGTQFFSFNENSPTADAPETDQPTASVSREDYSNHGDIESLQDVNQAITDDSRVTSYSQPSGSLLVMSHFTGQSN